MIITPKSDMPASHKILFIHPDKVTLRHLRRRVKEKSIAPVIVLEATTNAAVIIHFQESAKQDAPISAAVWNSDLLADDKLAHLHSIPAVKAHGFSSNRMFATQGQFSQEQQEAGCGVIVPQHSVVEKVLRALHI